MPSGESSNSNNNSSSSFIPMGSIFSLLTGFVLGASCAAAGAAYLFLYGAQHLGPVVRSSLEEKQREQKIVLEAITNRGESIVYPLTGIHTSPPIHRLGETNLCLRLSGGVLSIYQPEHHSSSSVSKYRSSSIMQVLAQFHVDRVIVHAITSKRIEIEALTSGSDPVCDVSFGALTVPATRICIDFYYRHEAAEVSSRCISGGSGAVGSSVFLRNSYRHVPAFYKFINSLPTSRLSPATVLLARILGASNDVQALKPFILSKLKKKLDKVVLPSPVKGTLEVSDLKLGRNSPAIGDIRLVNTPLKPTDGAVELAVDLEYNGGLEIALNVEIEVDSFISVKVPSITVTIKIQKLSGVLRLLAIPPPAKDLWIAFETTPDIKIGFAQKVNGGNTIVKALAAKIPDLSEIVTDVVKSSLLSDMVLPNRDDIPMPIIGDTPPSTPAEPENDGSIFEQFRASLPKSALEEGKLPSSSPAGSRDRGFLSDGGSSTQSTPMSSPAAAKSGNFKDDDIIFNRHNNNSDSNRDRSLSGGDNNKKNVPALFGNTNNNSNTATVPNKVQKKTIHINDTKGFTDLDTSVSAKAKADAEQMRRDQEAAIEREKKEEAAKKDEEPSLFDRFLSPSDDNKTKRRGSDSSTSKKDENNKKEEKSFFDKLHDRYDEYKHKKEEEEKVEQEKKRQASNSRSVSPQAQPTTPNVAAKPAVVAPEETKKEEVSSSSPISHHPPASTLPAAAVPLESPTTTTLTPSTTNVVDEEKKSATPPKKEVEEVIKKEEVVAAEKPKEQASPPPEQQQQQNNTYSYQPSSATKTAQYQPQW